MIKSTMPYLLFNGDCEKALIFYEEVFRAEIIEKMTFSDVGISTNGTDADLVAYSTFKIDGHLFAAADKSDELEPNLKLKIGNQISIWLEYDSEESLNKQYNLLKDKKCNIISELQEVFGDSKTAKIEDLFGVIWELYFQK